MSTSAGKLLLIKSMLAGMLDFKNYPGSHDQAAHGSWAESLVATDSVHDVNARAGQNSAILKAPPAVRGMTIREQIRKQVLEEAARAANVGTDAEIHAAIERLQAKKALVDKAKSDMDKLRNDDEPLFAKIESVTAIMFDSKKSKEEREAAKEENKKLMVELEKNIPIEKEINDRYFKLLGELNNEVRALVFANKTPAGLISISNRDLLDNSNSSAINEASDFINKVFSSDVLGADTLSGEHKIFIQHEKIADGRAYASYNTIHASPYDNTNAYIHEAGHCIEALYPEVRQQAREFLDKRTKGYDTVRMNDAEPAEGFAKDGGYYDYEITKPDHFIDPYMGKQYTGGATELLSMGLESLYRNPSILLDKDPEMFEFMLTVAHKVRAKQVIK